jgi:hypothetical protein
MRRWIASIATTVLVVTAAAAGCGGGSEQPVAAGSPSSGSDAQPFVPDGPSASAIVWAVGDGDASSAGHAVARLVARGSPDLLLYLGDVYPWGSARDFRANYTPAYGPLASKTAPTPGNHDWPNRSVGYLRYWATQRARATPPFYDFSAGGWQLLSLNSEIGPRADQMRWLRGRLQTPGTCRLAFWHRPRFSGGLHGDYRPMDPVWRALRGKARLVVSGHDHDMQRMRARNGLVQLVSGAGGHGHYRVNRRYRGLVFADDRSYGALRITLRPGTAQVDFVATGGRVLNSSSVDCQP